MKLHDVTALAIKLAGLVLFVLVLSKIPEYVNSYLSYPGSEHPYNYLFYVLPLFIVAIACLGLLFFPYTISNNLLFDSEASPSTDNINQYQIIAIRLLGLLLLFWSVSDAAYHVFVYLIYRDVIDLSYGGGTFDLPAFLTTCAEVIFSFVLLKKAKNISLLLNSTR